MKKIFKEAKKDFYLIAKYCNIRPKHLERSYLIQKEINRIRVDMNLKVENLIKLSKK